MPKAWGSSPNAPLPTPFGNTLRNPIPTISPTGSACPHSTTAFSTATCRKNDGLLITSMAGAVLRFEIDQVPLWRGNHVGVKQLVDDFAKYLYLPRVKNAQVILDAIQDGVGRLTWSQDTFAYADFYDAAADRYRGLEAGRRPTVQLNATSVVVKPDVAMAQIEKDSAPATTTGTGSGTGESAGAGTGTTGSGTAGTGGQTGKGTGVGD